MELSIGKSIKALRKEKDLTQERLAEIFGVSFQAVSKWETGAAYPDIEMLPGIARFFGVTTDALLGVDVSRIEEQIREICDEATRLFNAREYVAALPLLRKAVAKFPMSDELQYCLAWALRGNIYFVRDDLERCNALQEEAICIYQKLIETTKKPTLRLKAMQNLIHALDEFDPRALACAEQLPAFEFCREYILGRTNHLKGQELTDVLRGNIDLFGGAMIEALGYFAAEKLNGCLFTKEQAGELTVEAAKEKIALVKQVIGGEPSPPPPMRFSAYE
jgi:transcriptional regulator with XRE-family HTH domain